MKKVNLNYYIHVISPGMRFPDMGYEDLDRAIEIAHILAQTLHDSTFCVYGTDGVRYATIEGYYARRLREQQATA